MVKYDFVSRSSLPKSLPNSNLHSSNVSISRNISFGPFIALRNTSQLSNDFFFSLPVQGFGDSIVVGDPLNNLTFNFLGFFSLISCP